MANADLIRAALDAAQHAPVQVIGPAGSGKLTLTQQAAAALGLTVLTLDMTRLGPEDSDVVARALEGDPSRAVLLDRLDDASSSVRLMVRQLLAARGPHGPRVVALGRAAVAEVTGDIVSTQGAPMRPRSGSTDAAPRRVW